LARRLARRSTAAPFRVGVAAVIAGMRSPAIVLTAGAVLGVLTMAATLMAWPPRRPLRGAAR
jgi:hypothetical protein